MDVRSDSVARLRADLAAARFTVAHLEELWGTDAVAALGRGHRVPALGALDRLRAFDAAGTLARAFILGLPARPDDVERALPTLGLAGAVELGLVDESGTARIDLRPYAFTDSWGVAEWWIASDLGELALGGPLPENHVLGVGGASLTLSGLQVQRTARLA